MIRDNYNITNLFLDRSVKVFTDEGFFKLKIPTIREFLTNDELNASIHLWTLKTAEKEEIIGQKNISDYDFLYIILFDLGQYKEYSKIAQGFRNSLSFLLENIRIDFNIKQLKIDDVIITSEIWDYILYLLKLSYGEKVAKPLTFASEEARQFYLAQKANEEKIQALRNKQNKSEDDSLIKAFLSIIYAFPSLTIDYLFNQTMAQIQWLQKYAAGAVSYEVNAKAFAAGNMKKGSKLDFFIK